MTKSKAIKKTAIQCSVSEAEVLKEIEAAIDLGLASTDPAVQAHWNNIPKKGAKPTPEEVIDYVCKIAISEIT
jgi:hypothetical protein